MLPPRPLRACVKLVLAGLSERYAIHLPSGDHADSVRECPNDRGQRSNAAVLAGIVKMLPRASTRARAAKGKAHSCHRLRDVFEFLARFDVFGAHHDGKIARFFRCPDLNS